MNMLVVSTGQYAEKLNPLLEDLDDLHNAHSALSPTLRSSPEREKYKKQLHKMAELANDLRTMQTKLFICRDDVSRLIESNASTSNTTVSTQIQSILTTTVDTIGHDIKNLSTTYDGIRSAIIPHPQMDSRRVSWNSLYSTTSPLLRSPTTPFHHLSVVSEDSKPLDALRILSGDSSASGGSPIAGSSSIGSDEEVFEAIGLPRVRRGVPREPNIMEEMNARKERAAQGSNVVRELESVIEGRRKMKRMSTGRLGMAVTSNRISSL
jgi:tetrahydromethanopterin S-methyltransferase subunit B